MAWQRARHGLSQGELRQSMKVLRDVMRQSNDKKGGKSGDSYQRLVRRLSRSLQGISEETLTELGGKAYQSTLARGLYSEAISLIEAHRSAGQHLVIVGDASHLRAREAFQDRQNHPFKPHDKAYRRRGRRVCRTRSGN